MVNPYTTKNIFPSSLDQMNDYPTKTTFSTTFQQHQAQALTNPNTTYLEQKTLDSLPLASTSSPPRSPPVSSSRFTSQPSDVFWESFPFKLYPLEYSDDEDYGVKEESVYEFKTRLENSLRKRRKKWQEKATEYIDLWI